jgi:hypothetical protein
MLLVALGVVLGVRSARATAPDTTAPASATLASVPVDGKSGSGTSATTTAGSRPSPPPSALDIPSVPTGGATGGTAAVATTPFETARPVESGADNGSVKSNSPARSEGAGKADVSLTVDVSQLPAARPSRNRWTPVVARAQATGWTVATPAPSEQVPPPAGSASGTGGVNSGTSKADDGDWSPTEAPAVPAPSGKAASDGVPPAPAPTVDPFVQAVREDIREDEASRSK